MNNKKQFTPEQKEQYKQQKEAEKQELYALYKQFLERKTIQDFIGIIAHYKQLHTYSFNNMFMVLAQAQQRGDENFKGVLNSFLNWKKQEIQVLKGSKAYKVLVPIFTRVNPIEQEHTLQESTEQEQESKVLTYFKLGNAFDVWQTSEHDNYVREQKEIDRVIMKNAEIDYKTALNFVKSNFPEVTLIEDFKEQETKGVYFPISKEIVIYDESSHTIFHELGHYITEAILRIAGELRKDYAKNEVLAELTSYLLMRKFDERVNYNFAYSNCWASRIKDTFEVEEFEKDFKQINKFLENVILK